ncbi:hypothetical protein ES703_12701 [subsurface metagenome]
MRLLAKEVPLKEAILSYIKDVYPDIKGELPDVRVLDDEQLWKEIPGLRVWAFYDVTRNTLYFIGGPSPATIAREPGIEIFYRGIPARYTVAHEVEHWAQAQRVGPELYMKQVETEEGYLEYERAADEMGLANAPRLKWLG